MSSDRVPPALRTSRRPVRALAGLMAFALVAAACSTAGPEPTATPPPPTVVTAAPVGEATPMSVLAPAEPTALPIAPTAAPEAEAAQPQATPTTTTAPATRPAVTTAGTFEENNALCERFIGEKIPEGLSRYLRCGTFTVPELHAEPDGNQIKLPVVVIKSASQNPASDPLVMLQGGPGGSAIREFFSTIVRSGFSPGDDRDIILVDQRGSLLAQPSLTCPEYRETAIRHIQSGLMGEAAEQERLAANAACRERLAGAGINLAAYNSVENAADIAALPRALGYVDYNLYGKSYGGLLAQHIVALYPRGVRSVILDGAIPRAGKFALRRNANFQQALQKVADACAADELCDNDYPDIQNRFIALVNALNASPAPMTITTRSLTEVITLNAPLTGEALLSTIYTMMYDSYGISRLPRLMDLVEKGDLDYLTRLRERFELQVLNETTIGMFNSIFCSEEANFTEDEAKAADADLRPELQVFRSAREILATCKQWNVPLLGDDVHTAAQSDIPVLVLNGEFDPLTPPEFDAQAAAGFSNATQVLFRYKGHGQAPGNACAASLIANFLNAPATQLDAKCALGSQPIEFSTTSVQLTEFTDPLAGVGGKRPIGWIEISPGVFGDDVSVAAIQFEHQAVPNPVALRRQLETGRFRRTETRTIGEVNWQFFSSSGDGRLLRDIAVGNDGRFIVQLISADPNQRERLYREVLVPAVESFIAIQAPAQTIVIETPQQDNEVTSPAPVSGYTSRTPFENNLVYRVYNSAGLIISEGPITVKGSLGGPGTFATTLPFTVTQREAGRIEVVDIDVATGQPFATAAVSVTLVPVNLEGQPPVFLITIDTPAPNATLISPARVMGSISLTPFENNLVYRVLDASGAQVGNGPISVVGELGRPGTFDATIVFTPTQGGRGRLVIEAPNEAGGLPFATSAVDVLLEAPAAASETITTTGVITQTAPATLDPDKFSLNPAGLARRVTKEVRPSIPFNPNEPPQLNGWPPHLRFRFDDDRPADDYFAPRQRQLLIFPVAEYRAQFTGDELAEFDAMIASLKAMLESRPGTITETITVLPTIGASQVLRSQIGYLDFDGGSCVRFITAYRQDVGAITDADTFYTCQGLSDNGRYFVSFVYPVSSTALPASARRVTRAELARIEKDPEGYLRRVEAALNRLPSRGFRPSLAQLDTVMKSLKIAP